jgi:hypothetical protein
LVAGFCAKPLTVQTEQSRERARASLQKEENKRFALRHGKEFTLSPFPIWSSEIPYHVWGVNQILPSILNFLRLKSIQKYFILRPQDGKVLFDCIWEGL